MDAVIYDLGYAKITLELTVYHVYNCTLVTPTDTVRFKVSAGEIMSEPHVYGETHADMLKRIVIRKANEAGGHLLNAYAATAPPGDVGDDNE